MNQESGTPAPSRQGGRRGAGRNYKWKLSFRSYRSSASRYFKFIILAAIIFIAAFPAPAVHATHMPGEEHSPAFETGKGAVLQKLLKAGGGELAPLGTGETDLAIFTGNIVNAALLLIGVIFFALTLYGGALYLTASGNEEQVKKAKHTIVRAAIGILIVLFAASITRFVTGYLARPVTPPEAEGPAEFNIGPFSSCPSGYTEFYDYSGFWPNNKCGRN